MSTRQRVMHKALRGWRWVPRIVLVDFLRSDSFINFEPGEINVMNRKARRRARKYRRRTA